MALFQVNRYTAVEGSDGVATSPRESLQKLHIKAAQRKINLLEAKKRDRKDSKGANEGENSTGAGSVNSLKTPEISKKKKNKKKKAARTEVSPDRHQDFLLRKLHEKATRRKLKLLEESKQEDCPKDASTASNVIESLSPQATGNIEKDKKNSKKRRKESTVEPNEVVKMDNGVKIKKKKRKSENTTKLKETDEQDIHSSKQKKRRKMRENDDVDGSTGRETEYLAKTKFSKKSPGENMVTKIKNSNKSGAKSNSEQNQTEQQASKIDVDINTVKEKADEKEKVIDSKTKEPRKTSDYIVLGTDEKQPETEMVHRVLPDWLSNPSVIENSISDQSCPITSLTGLHPKIISRLKENDITHFFPVQRQVIPVILDSTKNGLFGKAGYIPNDICVSAPTGSGKTLAFVLPIIQALMGRVVTQVRALAVLPTRELASQIFGMFTSYSKGTNLKAVLLAGQKTFSHEQTSLVRLREGETEGYTSLGDIVVATPGRLVDHINKTPGFCLKHLRFLVIDEADRMMDKISQNWIQQVEQMAYISSDTDLGRSPPGQLTLNRLNKLHLPMQKLLFSATLSQNPEKLIQLNLFQPKLFTSVVASTTSSNSQDQTSLSRNEFIGKYTTPAELKELILSCTIGEKPLMVLHLLLNCNYENILCFTNTKEATHRLFLLLKFYGDIEVAELSSALNGLQRKQVLKQFELGKIKILICSDVMARGMDISNAQYVLCYDVPPFIKNYIHRVGRTARAGKTGTAISLVADKESKRFRKMLQEAGKMDLQKFPVKRNNLKQLTAKYEEVLEKIPAALKEEETQRLHYMN